jgi:hypothetical protein
MSKISVIAGTATHTTTGVFGAVDVDFTLTIDGEEYEGDVTLCPCKDGQSGYDRWGDLSNWLDSDTIKALEDLPDGERLEVINAIAVECIAVADASGIEPDERLKVDGEDVILSPGDDGYIVATVERLGAVSQGRTREAALLNIREAIEVSRD